MSDHPEAGLDGTTPQLDTEETRPAEQPSAGIFGANPDKLEILDLDDLLSNAKRVTRTATICTDGTLENEWHQLVTELQGLVDENGEVATAAEDEEPSLEDTNRVTEINRRLLQLHKLMRAASRAVIFEAMPGDKYEALEARLLSDNKNRDVARFSLEVIAASAIEPKLTIPQVAQLKQQLNKAQFLELANNAFWANTTGGTTIPKLPSYSTILEQETSLSS